MKFESVTTPQRDRARIERQVADYLASGGTITEVPTGVSNLPDESVNGRKQRQRQILRRYDK